MRFPRPMQLLPAVVLLAATPALATDELIVTDAFARATPPGSTVSSAYFNLANEGNRERILVGAAAEVAGRVEMHTHEHDDEAGMHRMRQVSEVPVPAGGKVVFEPGGMHIMLMELDESLDVGGEIELSLRFDDGALVPVVAEIRRPGREHEQRREEMETREGEDLAPDNDPEPGQSGDHRHHRF